MLRRLSGLSARYVQQPSSSRLACLQISNVLQSPTRQIHSSTVSHARRGELTKLERQTIAEINLLKKQVEDDTKEQIAKESAANLPEITDESLDLLYEALNMPDPPTEEDMEEEQKRRKQLLPPFQKDQVRQQSLSRRLEDIKKRLDEVVNYTQKDATERSGDASERLTKILQSVEKDESMSVADQGNEDELTQAQAGSSISEGHTSTQRSTTRDLIAQLQVSIPALSNNSSLTMAFPLGLLSTKDWTALAYQAAVEDDRNGILQILKLMEESGQTSMQTKVINTALAVYSKEGDFKACQSLTTAMEENGIVPDAFSSHHLVAAYARAGRLDEAAAIVKHLQDVQPASMQTYTLLIEHYLQKASQPQIQSKAWSLFYDMRTYAHSIPDAHLYAQMIRACALGVPQPGDALWKPRAGLLAESNTISKKRIIPKPGRALRPDTERALDLFREMTLRYNVRPTPEVYSAVILACTRRRDMYEKGIELFQSMLEIERQRITALQSDEETKSDLSLSFSPDRETYNAVLGGCCQVGDLLRARWILAEMLRSSYALWTSLRSRPNVADWEWAEVETRRPDEFTLTYVFYTYATFKPPKRASIKKVKVQKEGQAEESESSEQPPHSESTDVEPTSKVEDNNSFSERLPESSAGAIREVNGLLERVAVDATTEGGLLSAVIPDTRMLNAYLSVLSEQCTEADRLPMLESAIFGASDEKSRYSVFDGDSVFAKWQVPINGYTCELALEACSKSKDREHADALADRIWQEWQKISEPKTRGSGTEAETVKEEKRMQGIDPVRISRCWANMIRNAAKSNRIKDAMNLLHSFVEKYPPATSSMSALPQQQRNSVRPAAQYPALTFQQVEVLHHRLVLSTNNPKQRHRDLAFITWVIKAYESSLSPKMPAVLKRPSKLW
ncbi:uncharacterized protein FA14DRAFT_187694 [Meira miltonrushii]|uniref:Pentacotripeptide-repeat region of PRORP domain-containing protein n=1 Tax=Meira miltonrushii TaxID=1280837 RepID=A0A316VJD2_9BASI|nr:uncharacterized protein FA14DRAFT_187694 [Meira miltonrushii]PWN37610.1 hypothetical protein FA14DRAFT_187694 [Meira miltonrushii]